MCSSEKRPRYTPVVGKVYNINEQNEKRKIDNVKLDWRKPNKLENLNAYVVERKEYDIPELA